MDSRAEVTNPVPGALPSRRFSSRLQISSIARAGEKAHETEHLQEQLTGYYWCRVEKYIEDFNSTVYMARESN